MPNSNGSAITDYELQRWEPGENNAAGTWGTDVLGGDPTTQTLFTDGTPPPPRPSRLTPGRTYYYRIRAMNAADDNDATTLIDNVGAWSADTTSNAVSVTTDSSVPTEPTDVCRYSCP